MPTLKLSDQFGLSVDVVPNPRSGIAQYLGDAVRAVITGFDLSRISGLDIHDPAITSFQTGLEFNRPASVATGVTGNFGIFVPRRSGDDLFSTDDYGENVPVAADERFVSVGIRVSARAGGTVGGGSLAAGFAPGTAFEVLNYRKFSTRPAPPSILSALTATLRDFSIPADVEDLGALPETAIVLLNGSGSLRFSSSVNLLAVSNPLATVALPGGAAGLDLKAGGSFEVSAGFELSCDYQIRVQKLEDGRVRLGYYRKRGSEVTVGATVNAGATARIGAFDLYPLLIRAISSNFEADRAALENAGLSDGQIDAIEGAVKAGIGRKLELAASAELGVLKSDQAAFLYELDLGALDASGRQAVERALHGDLSDLEESEHVPLAGIATVRSLASTLRSRTHTFRVNLIGIYNFSSISNLTLSGTVVFEPFTGDLVITDSATAERIRTASVPLQAVPERLRYVLAESFLITAAYRGSRAVAAAPSLASAHTFFERLAKTDRVQLEDGFEVGAALGIMPEAEAHALVGTLEEFGPTTFYVETRYGDDLTAALFLDDDHPRPLEEYETAGRETIQLLVRSGDPDAYRRQPATDDGLWSRMKAAGQANFTPLFPHLTREQVRVIEADYTVIVWWAATMRKTAEKLAEVRACFQEHPHLSPNDNRFQRLRVALAEHLRKVARDTKEEFGRPWGLIAMDRVSGRLSEAEIRITGNRIALFRERPRVLGAPARG